MQMRTLLVLSGGTTSLAEILKVTELNEDFKPLHVLWESSDITSVWIYSLTNLIQAVFSWRSFPPFPPVPCVKIRLAGTCIFLLGGSPPPSRVQ